MSARKLFREIAIQTPEGVEINLPLAGIGSRAYALMMDYLLLALLLGTYLLIWSLLTPRVNDALEALGGNYSELFNWAIALLILGLFFLFVGYFAIAEAWGQGQTPGKKLAQIRVIRDDGRPVGIFQSTTRSLLRPIDDTLFIGFLFIVLNKQEKRLGDFVAGTLVVQAAIGDNNKAKFDASEEGKAAAKALLQATSFEPMLPDDFATIREYLRRRSSMAKDARLSLSKRLGEEVKAILQLEQLPYDMSADTFLEGVYIGYQASQDDDEYQIPA